MIALFIGLICSSLIIILGIYIIIALLFQVPFYPSRITSLDTFSKELEKYIAGKRCIDAGSGDGSVVHWFSKNAASYSVGIEYNPFLTLLSRFKNIFNSKRSSVQFINGNFFHYNYKNSDVVYMYLFQEIMEKLLPMLEKQLPKNAVIISNTFKFKSIEPIETFGKFRVYRLNSKLPHQKVNEQKTG